MIKFAVLFFVWIVASASVFAQATNVTSSSESTEEEVRDFFGLMTIKDPSRFYIRYFRDPFPVMQPNDGIVRDFRWRIYTPDASGINIYWSHGILPDDGQPTERRALIAKPLPVGPADIVLAIHANGDEGKSFRSMMYPVYESHHRGTLQGFRTTKADWVPYYEQEACVEENPDREKTSEFNLDTPFTIMKHYTVTGGMEKKGFMIWIEKCDWESR